MASAIDSVCDSVSRQSVTPRSSASAAARPETRSVGAPDSVRSTSTSCQSKAPNPTPSAFMTASLAANRTAYRGAGSRAASA